jgi:restriction endonuclease S subunit
LNHQKKKIADVGNITIGLLAKRKQADKNDISNKNYQMLTLKSFNQDGFLDTKGLEDFQSTEILDEKYLTCVGDVLIRLSEPHTAITICDDNKGILIPSLFSVIRLTGNMVLPEYLAIYLNSEKMQRFYSKQSIGSTIQVMKTSSIKDIEIEIPSIEKQEKIIEINNLILREKKLLAKLIKEKNLYYRAIINKLI